MTARQLASLLAAEGVRFGLDAGVIVVTGVVPPEMVAVAKVLKTGLAATGSGRVWYALPASGRAVVLDPAALVPGWAKCLAVGDSLAGWDRVRHGWRLDYPHLFDATAEPQRSKR